MAGRCNGCEVQPPVSLIQTAHSLESWTRTRPLGTSPPKSSSLKTSWSLDGNEGRESWHYQSRFYGGYSGNRIFHASLHHGLIQVRPGSPRLAPGLAAWWASQVRNTLCSYAPLCCNYLGCCGLMYTHVLVYDKVVPEESSVHKQTHNCMVKG